MVFDIRSTYYDQLIEYLNEDYEEKIIEYLNKFNNKNNDEINEINEYSNNLNLIENLEWINTNKGFNVKNDLNGKIVLFDFWTYCCINCMHIIPLLKKLEDEYKQLIVIGVHSAKFTNEKSKKNILYAAHRHLIKHPIVCDNDLELWSKLDISCWPTLMLLNPSGQIIAEFQGELHAQLVQKILPICFKYYKSQLKEIPFETNNDMAHEININLNELCFPSKLCLNNKKSLLFISDSGNNRILGVDVNTNSTVCTIGSGSIGYNDGSFEIAEFDWPQGLTINEDEQLLYVADTGNDIIREIDLEKGIVSTLCGKYNSNVTKIGDYDYVGGKVGLEQPISSPWDVSFINRDCGENKKQKFLLIACAGTHQIWLYSFKSNVEKLVWWRNVTVEAGTLHCVVGNGKERNRNNSYPLQASLAQPSGICVNTTMECVYLADAESSTIRVISLKDGSVKNVVGGDASQPDNLFAYGDVDGKGGDVRLQHPMDVRCANLESEFLFIADAYNNKIKIVDLKSKQTSNYINLEGKRLTLAEPNGLCVDQVNNCLYIADTNNHSIKIIQNILRDNEVQIKEFQIKFSSIGVLTDNKTQDRLSDNMKFEFILKFNFHLNENAENTWSLNIETINKESTKVCGLFNKSNKINENEYKIESLDVDQVNSVVLIVGLVYCITDKKGIEMCKMLKQKKELKQSELKKLTTQNRKLVLIISI